MKRTTVHKKSENHCPYNSMPVCQYYLEGRCNSESCPYRHVNVGSDAQICPQFNRGFCPNGDQVFTHPLVSLMARQQVKEGSHQISLKEFGRLLSIDVLPLCKRKHLFVRKKDKTKSKTKLKSQKSVKKSIKSLKSENQCLTEQSLPQFIAISNANDNNIKTDSNLLFVDNNCQQISEQFIEQTIGQTVPNNTNNNKNNRKEKYFWLESDEEIIIDSESTEQLSARLPAVAIVPNFLF